MREMLGAKNRHGYLSSNATELNQIATATKACAGLYGFPTIDSLAHAASDRHNDLWTSRASRAVDSLCRALFGAY